MKHILIILLFISNILQAQTFKSVNLIGVIKSSDTLTLVRNTISDDTVKKRMLLWPPEGNHYPYVIYGYEVRQSILECAFPRIIGDKYYNSNWQEVEIPLISQSYEWIKDN